MTSSSSWKEKQMAKNRHAKVQRSLDNCHKRLGFCWGFFWRLTTSAKCKSSISAFLTGRKAVGDFSFMPIFVWPGADTWNACTGQLGSPGVRVRHTTVAPSKTRVSVNHILCLQLKIKTWCNIIKSQIMLRVLIWGSIWLRRQGRS